MFEIDQKARRLSDEEKESLKVEGKLFQIESKIIRQGLDLKGGMFIALEADIPNLVKNLASNRNQKFDDLLLEVTNDFKSNEGSNFFDIFRKW